MAKVTGFKCFDSDGQAVMCDPYGNNAAFNCPKCSHPMLATIRPNGRGSDKEHRVACKRCGLEAWVEVKAEEHSLWINWSQSN